MRQKVEVDLQELARRYAHALMRAAAETGDEEMLFAVWNDRLQVMRAIAPGLANFKAHRALDQYRRPGESTWWIVDLAHRVQYGDYVVALEALTGWIEEALLSC